MIKDCIDARLVWNEVFESNLPIDFFHSGPTNWFIENLSKLSIYHDGVPWNVRFETTYWLSWKWRNARVFTLNVIARRSIPVCTISREYFKMMQTFGPIFNMNNSNDKLIAWRAPRLNSIKINTNEVMNQDTKADSTTEYAYVWRVASY